MKYTVYFDQINLTNFQVEAKSETQAETKAIRLYRKKFEIPSSTVEKGWLVESDGEDKG
jgi:hypothetical protein